MKRYFSAVLAAGLLALTFTACSADDGRVGGDRSGNMMDDAASVVSDAIDHTKSAVSEGMRGAESAVSDLMDGADSMLNGDASKTESRVSNGMDTNTGMSTDQEAIGGSLPVASSFSTKKNGWGQGKTVDDKNRPVAAVQAAGQYGKYGALFLGEDEGAITLTFDEGYENGYTPVILDTLKEKGVTAVFFVTGDYVKRQPELIRRMIDEGHAVGNHTQNHPSMPDLTEEKMRQEITELHQTLEQEFGYTMTLFRPPMGEFSEQSLAVTQSLGYRSVFWSFAYKDWVENEGIGAKAALEKTTAALHPGAIYLLHAVSADNAAMLGDFIDAARAAGYTFTI